jgi:hypothetical protein
MKFKLSAGAEVDVLTEHELRKALKDYAQDWMVEARTGPKSVLWWGSGAVSATGTLSIGGASVDPNAGGRYGPDPSMVWSIKRWNVRGLANGDSLSAFINDAAAQRSIIDTVTGYNRFGSDELVIGGADKLLFTGTGLMTVAGTVITVSGSAWELPRTMLYRLM